MRKIAKLLIIDPDGKHLLMYRSNHPRFGEDPDLPGGTVEENESLLETLVREVKEEAGADVDESDLCKVYSGTEYSASGTQYCLFISKLEIRPRVVISWEHSSYEWLDQDSFLKKSKGAKDTYMHMVHDAIKNIDKNL